MNLCLAEVGLRKEWDGDHVDFSDLNDFSLMRPYFQFRNKCILVMNLGNMFNYAIILGLPIQNYRIKKQKQKYCKC